MRPAPWIRLRRAIACWVMVTSDASGQTGMVAYFPCEALYREQPGFISEERHDDRLALLDHAERPQDHDFSGGDRPSLQDLSGQHRQGRAVQEGVSRDITQ